jgi:hypothetical protein
MKLSLIMFLMGITNAFFYISLQKQILLAFVFITAGLVVASLLHDHWFEEKKKEKE